MPKLRKFIETHWLFYAFQGLASLAFGGYLLFTKVHYINELASFAGVALLFLGIVEVFSLLYRKHYGGSLILSLILAVSEVGIALLLLFTADYNMAVPLTLTAIYTIGRGILELFLAFTAISDKTDRFMWVVCGICGTVIGFVILNSGNFADNTLFFRFFATYMMIYGVTNLVYGIHNRNELIEMKETRAAKRKAARAAKTSKITKKSTKKLSKKAKKARK